MKLLKILSIIAFSIFMFSACSDNGVKSEAKDKVMSKAEMESAKAELASLRNHIANNGNYGLIDIGNLDGKLFKGKNCTEALRLVSSLETIKDSSRNFGFIVNGNRGEISDISRSFGFGVEVPIYAMPESCNLFAEPALVKSSCALDKPSYLDKVYEVDPSTNIVTKFGRFYCNGCLYKEPEKNAWRVVGKFDESFLQMPIVRIQKEAKFENKPYTIDRRHYVCTEGKDLSPSPATTSTPIPPTNPAPVITPPSNQAQVTATASAPVVDNTPFAPSFDCTKASNTMEKLICSNRQLSVLDVKLNQAYLNARNTTQDKEKLKSNQIAWIKQARTCEDIPCLQQSLQLRINQITTGN